MVIKSLDQMEAIVEKNDSLSWNGWDVVEYTKDPMAFTKIEAALVNGTWFRTKTYAVTEQGWEIPNKFMR